MFINSELLYFVFLYWLTQGKIIEGLQDFQGMGIVSLISRNWLLVPEYTLYTVQLNGTQELLNKWLLDLGYIFKLKRAQVTWNPNYNSTVFPATSFLFSFAHVVVLFYVSTLEYKARWSRAQNNSWSKDNIWPELQLALPKTSVTTGHIDWSRMHSRSWKNSQIHNHKS